MSFISNYLEFTDNTESPFQYHQWSCLATLSVLAGRRFWFNLGPIRYYPNLYVVLVGHPGVKKSSALDRAKEVTREINCCPIAAAQATKEFIAKAMSNEKFRGKKFFTNADGIAEEYNQYAIFATELTQFIGVNPIGMLDFLTTVYTEKVYDCDTKGQGSDLVVGPYITMLACLTPEMLKGFLKMNILTGGFARRTAFVYGTGGQIIPIPGYTSQQIAARVQCVEWGKKVQSFAGEFKFGPGGEEFYVEWYTQLHTKMTEIAKPSTEGWYKTRHEILFKGSMLVALSEWDFVSPLFLLPQHMEVMTKRFLEPLEKNLERVFEGAGINPNSHAAIQICRMLEAMDRPMNKKHVEAMFFDQATDLNALRDTMTHLIAVGRLEEKTLSVQNQLLGTVIAASGVLKRFSDVDLAKFLARGGGLPPATDTGPRS